MFPTPEGATADDAGLVTRAGRALSNPRRARILDLDPSLSTHHSLVLDAHPRTREYTINPSIFSNVASGDI